MWGLKWLFLLLGALGLVLVFVMQQSWTAIFELLGLGGLSLLWIVPLHGLPLLLDTLGWRRLLIGGDPPITAPIAFLFWVASVREAVSRLLPLASVGGEIVGIRLLMLRGWPGPGVTASVLVEVLLTLVNQAIFSAIGLLCLLTLAPATKTSVTVTSGLALALVMPLALLFALRSGSVFQRLRGTSRTLLGGFLDSLGFAALPLDEALMALLEKPRTLISCLTWEFTGYLLGASETWLALHLLGHGVTPRAAVALEAMTQAVRHFVFFVPAGLGVQEVTLIGFGKLLGVPEEVGIALSLIKRMRELIWGIPALISWQVVEVWNLRRGSRHQRFRPAG